MSTAKNLLHWSENWRTGLALDFILIEFPLTLNLSFRPDGFLLSVTINPNVNNSLYLDVPATQVNIDWLNLATFDVQTPLRTKKEADFNSPLYAPSDRNPELNVDYQVTDLIKRGFPAAKINVGIPTVSWFLLWRLSPAGSLSDVLVNNVFNDMKTSETSCSQV